MSPSQVMQGIFAFFCTHAAGLAGKFQHLVLVMLVSGRQRHPTALGTAANPQGRPRGRGQQPWGTLLSSFGSSSGHSFPLHPLLAVVFGEIWEENGSDGGLGGEFVPVG